MKNIFAIINLDVSSSMRGLKSAGQKTYDEMVDSLLSQSDSETNIFVGLTTFAGKAEYEVPLSRNKASLRYSYNPNGGSTAIFDGVKKAVEVLGNGPGGSEDSFLVITITDGEDNNSFTSPAQFRKLMKDKEDLGNWTFTFNLPKGKKDAFVRLSGVPQENCREWEQTTVGLEETSYANVRAISNYASFVKSAGPGGQSVRSFYADTAGIDSGVLKDNLGKVNNQFKKLPVAPNYEGTQIRDFVNNKGYNYKKGNGFYELSKKELVQEYKQIVIEDRNGDLYTGNAARTMIGVPTSGNIKLSPEDYPAVKVFVQSTAPNRSVKGGTTLLWKIS